MSHGELGSPRGPHLLNGIALAPLCRLLAQAGGIRPARFGDLASITGRALQSMPLAARERHRFAQRAGQEPHPQPVFIIGHYRSGTTYLHELLARNPTLAYPTTFEVFFPRMCLASAELLQPAFTEALPATRCTDGVALRADAPHEDEFALGQLSTMSFYHALYFPKRWRALFERGVLLEDAADRRRWRACYHQFLTKVSLRAGGRPLLLKNPAHSARIELLLDMYPGARFVHIYRNPFAVYLSTLRFYRRFIDAYGLQATTDEEVEELTFHVYEQLMSRLLASSPRLGPRRIAHVCYEHLLAAPLQTLASVHETLGLDGFFGLRSQLETNPPRPFRVNAHRLSAAQRTLVCQRWDTWLDRLGYDPAGEYGCAPARLCL